MAASPFDSKKEENVHDFQNGVQGMLECFQLHSTIDAYLKSNIFGPPALPINSSKERSLVIDETSACYLNANVFKTDLPMPNGEISFLFGDFVDQKNVQLPNTFNSKTQPWCSLRFDPPLTFTAVKKD